MLYFVLRLMSFADSNFAGNQREVRRMNPPLTSPVLLIPDSWHSACNVVAGHVGGTCHHI
jgi:hypothetical protein